MNGLGPKGVQILTNVDGQDAHANLPLPPATQLRQDDLDPVVFIHHQLASLIEAFGPDGS